MAKATITFEDEPEGIIRMGIDYDPEPCEGAMLTSPAQVECTHAYQMLNTLIQAAQASQQPAEDDPTHGDIIAMSNEELAS
jgi:hypothetical protein